MKASVRVFDFEAHVSFTDALKAVEAALDDEGLDYLVGNTTNRPTMVRMNDAAGRLIDRLFVPASRITTRSPR